MRLSTLVPMIAFASYACAPVTGAQALRPIQETDLWYYAEIVRLSEDQRTLAKAFLDDYQARVETDYRPQYRMWLAAQSDYMRAAGRPEEHEFRTVELYKASAALHDKVFADLDMLDAGFFRDLQSILAPDQFDRFARVYHARHRQLFRRSRSVLPEANVDLFAFLDDANLSDAVRADVSALYESEFVRLIRASYEARSLAEGDTAERLNLLALQKQHKPQTPEWNEIAMRLRRIEERSGRFSIPPSDNLVHFNRTFLAELKELLAPREYAAIETKYLREAYPEVYPDPGTAEALYAAALKLDDVDDNTRAAIKGLRDSFRFDHDRLSRRMCESIFKRRRASLKNEPIISLWDELLEIGRQRERMNQDQLALLRVLLTPEQVKQLPGWDFVAQPPPRPWDPKWRPDPNAITIQLPQPGEPPVVKVIRPGDDAMHTPRPGEPEANEH